MNALVIGLALLAMGGAPTKPRLVVQATPIVGISDYSGQTPTGLVTVIARIEGPITEQWYCPKVVFVWPDDTRSTEESDCEPYTPELAVKAQRRWVKRIWVPEGNWLFRVQLWKNNKRLSEQTALSRVGSPQERLW